MLLTSDADDMRTLISALNTIARIVEVRDPLNTRFTLGSETVTVRAPGGTFGGDEDTLKRGRRHGFPKAGMNRHRLVGLIDQGESSTLEFKRDGLSIESLAKE